MCVILFEVEKNTAATAVAAKRDKVGDKMTTQNMVVKAGQVWRLDDEAFFVMSVTTYTAKEDRRRWCGEGSSPKKVTFCNFLDKDARCIPVQTMGCYAFEDAYQLVA